MKKYILTIAVLLIFGLISPLTSVASDNGLSNADFFYGISIDQDKGPTMEPLRQETAVKEDRKTDPFREMSPGYFFGYINVYAGKQFVKRLHMKRQEHSGVKFDAEKSLSPDYFFGYRNP